MNKWVISILDLKHKGKTWWSGRLDELTGRVTDLETKNEVKGKYFNGYEWYHIFEVLDHLGDKVKIKLYYPHPDIWVPLDRCIIYKDHYTRKQEIEDKYKEVLTAYENPTKSKEIS